MSDSLRTHLDAVLPKLSPSLAPQRTRTKLRALAATIPGSSLAGLECRLGHGGGEVDLQVLVPRLSRVERTHAFLGPHLPDIAVVHRWVEADGELAEATPSIWLEYDLGAEGYSGTAPVPRPSVFVTLGEDSGALTHPRGARSIALALFPERTPGLNGLLDCLETVPTGGAVTHLGRMTDRPGRPFCLRVSGLSPAAVAGWCRDLGFPQAGTPVTALAEAADDLVLLVALEGPVPRVGIECFVHTSPAQAPELWHPLLDHLETLGLATPARAEGVRLWPGVQPVPAQAGGIPLPFADTLVECLVRQINHVKVRLVEHGLGEAKAYLRFKHRWVSRRNLGAPSPGGLP